MRRPLRVQPLENRLAPALATWDGGGADNHWTTAANWVGDLAPNPGDDLSFNGVAPQLVNVNDFPAGTAFGSLVFIGPSYQITGNAVTLTHIGSDSFAGSNQLIGLSMGGTADLSKGGAGILRLSGANTYSSQSFVTDGDVYFDGSQSSPIVVTGGTVHGGGNIAAVNVTGGGIDPGAFATPDVAGVLTTGNVSIDPFGFHTHMDVFVENSGAGVSGDRVAVHGAVQVGGQLNIHTASLAQAGPLNLGTITIIDNDGSDPISGTFSGLPEGAIIAGVRDKAARISYHGGDGNDVTLTVVNPSSTPAFSVGAGAGGTPQVNVYFNDGRLVRAFNAYDPAFRGGVHVATADITGDGVKDIITGPGPGGGPDVRVFDGATGAIVREFLAYSAVFTGGVFVATGDVNGDGTLDIITGAGASGGPHVRVFSGTNGAVLLEFMAYDMAFRGGVNVAAGDTNDDGHADIMTGPGSGGGPHVRVFDGATGAVTVNIIAYDPNFRGGVFVAALPGVIGNTAIVTAPGTGGGPDIRVFINQFADTDRFFAYDPNFRGGVAVGVAPIGPNGENVILTGAGPGGGPHVKSFLLQVGSPPAQELSFFAFDPSFTGGVFVG